jgi:hypothetical protein
MSFDIFFCSANLPACHRAGAAFEEGAIVVGIVAQKRHNECLLKLHSAGDSTLLAESNSPAKKVNSRLMLAIPEPLTPVVRSNTSFREGVAPISAASLFNSESVSILKTNCS